MASFLAPREICAGSKDHDDPRPVHLVRRRSSEPRSHHAAPGPRAASQRVLVVDDEQENLDLVHRCLRRRFTVDTAASPRRALDLLNTHNYDIIISDQRMPGMTGTQLLQESQKHAPDAVRIVITGYSDYAATIEAINIGKVSGFIQKPFVNRTLLDMIDAAGAGTSSVTVPRPVDKRFRDLADNLPDAVAVVEDDKVVFGNEALAALFRVDQAELLYDQPLTQLLSVYGEPNAFGERKGHALAGAELLPVATKTSRMSERGASIVRIRPVPVSSSSERPVILVVDDDARMLRSLRRLLFSKHVVHCAQNLEEALQIGRTVSQIDAFICTDRCFSKVTEGLRGLGHAIDGRAVAMTVSAESHGGGACPVLCKPFSREELTGALNAVLTQSRREHV